MAADDLKQTGKPDDARINVEQELEVRYWAKKFRVNGDEDPAGCERGWPDG